MTTAGKGDARSSSRIEEAPIQAVNSGKAPHTSFTSWSKAFVRGVRGVLEPTLSPIKNDPTFSAARS